MKNNKDFTARFRIPEKEWEAFKEMCEKLEEKPSKMIREFIKRWMGRKSGR